MKLSWKITLLCVALFALCGLTFGLLQRGVELQQRDEGIVGKAESVAVAVGNFAASDVGFAKKSNLEAIKKRAGLSSLEVEIAPLSAGNSFANPLTTSDENGKIISVFRTKNKTSEISVRAEIAADLGGGLLLSLAEWVCAGAFVGALTAFVILKFLLRRLSELKNFLKSGANSAYGNSKIRIAEFDDLAYAATLLKEVNSRRAQKECAALDVYNSDFNLEEAVLDKVMPPLAVKYGGCCASIAFAHSKSDGAFYLWLGDGKILYARLESRNGALRRLSDTILARELSKSAIAALEPWDAFMKVSRTFEFSHWSILQLCPDCVSRIGLEAGEWGEEHLKLDESALFSTALMGRAMRFYSRLEIGESSDRLRSLMRLSSPSEGGLFILIEKNYD